MLQKFFNWFSKHFLCCREAARLISESCERPLSPSERWKLRALTFMCPYTANYQEQIGMLHKRVGNCCDKEDISEKVEDCCLSEECKERLKEKMSQA